MADWTDETCVPALYDKSHIEYSNRTVKKSLEEQIAQHLGKPRM